MDKQLISTCYASIERDCEKYTALWRLPENDGPLENVVHFPSEKYGTDVKVFYTLVIVRDFITIEFYFV